MAINLNECRESKSGFVITCKGRLSYAQYAVDGQENKKTGKLKYSGSLLVPKEGNLTFLKNRMGKIALDKTDDQNRAKALVNKRFLDPNNLPNGGKPAGEEFEGWTLIRASSDYKPKIFYPNGDTVPDEEVKKEIYSGRWASFLLNPYWFSHPENTGIFLGLQGIQLLDHDENIGTAIPDAEGEFDAVDGPAPEASSGDASTAEENVDAMFG